MPHLESFHQEQEALISLKYASFSEHMNERCRRLWAGAEAESYGFGGAKLVSRATNISYNTVCNGRKEIKEGSDKGTKIRKSGGGRKSLIEQDDSLLSDFRNLIEPATRGDPESPLLWTSKSVSNISKELQALKHNISDRSVYNLLKKDGYSLQSNKKSNEGTNHPDRNAQFEFINEKTKQFQMVGSPVISVDTKKKENIGNFKNNGQEYCKKGFPTKVNTYDFVDKTKGKVAPYGIYDVEKNNGWVSVGISSDTAEFAVNSIRKWWKNMGKSRYSEAKEIYINADGGGSNGSRNRLWKVELQKLSNEINMIIHVSHFSPGTSKWNKIEHKMFSFISKNWRGKPLIDTTTIVNLIGNTTTKRGLKIIAELDENEYQKGIKISDEELKKVNIEKNEFHGEWNYKIIPDK